MVAALLNLSEMPEAAIYLRVSTKQQAERGGEAEGFSIPAQRGACHRKADQLGANVVAEFVDAGESAKKADRAELQRMLAYLAANPTRYVIVDKVDRMARNRADDIDIHLAIRRSGATLASVHEAIDETPSGMLLHGIMSSIAEFYSANLALEIEKGTKQKVQSGGTPTVAPIGYLNVRKMIEGREVRTIAVDPERAHHIRWAFETYGTGDWTIKQVVDALDNRGLTRRPTRTRDARPIPTNKLHEILRNRYYIGYVAWRGVEYAGSHEPLVPVELFQRVQDILARHRESFARPQRHTQYLNGTVFCARCGYRLGYTRAKSRSGQHYEYWICLGKHNGRTDCDLPSLPFQKVEDSVTAEWALEEIPAEAAAEIREGLLADAKDFGAGVESKRELLRERVHSIKRERFKWAEKSMSGAIPDDISQEKQQELALQLGRVEAELEVLDATGADHVEIVECATRLIADCGRAYVEADEQTRRAYNQAWFQGIYLNVVDGSPVIARIERTEVVERSRRRS